MQTFVTHEGWMKTAANIDNARCGKQISEVLQILDGIVNGVGYVHHPALNMWRGYEDALVLYGLCFMHEWIVNRGHRYDGAPGKFQEWMNDLGMADKAVTIGASGRVTGVEPNQEISRPPWIGDRWFMRSHRSALIRKVPSRYEEMYPGTPYEMPYLWPHVDVRSDSYDLRISMADMKRLETRERILPRGLEVDIHTRVVTVL